MGNAQSRRTPIQALRPSSREVIAGPFDRLGRVHNGRLNDYRGALELIRCTSEEIEDFSRCPSPSLRLLNDWPEIARSRRSRSPTIEDGRRILEQLGRQDIIEQCSATVDEDIEIFHSRRQTPIMRSQSTPAPARDDPEFSFITIQDVNFGNRRSRIIYDAFIVSAPSDNQVVQQMALLIEGPRYRLRLLIPERDLLPGIPEYTVWAYAIDKRCRKLILVVGEEFMENKYCKFAVRYATALSPDAKNRKIIIIKTSENINICRELNFHTYFRAGGDEEQLISAIKAPSNPEPIGHRLSDPLYRNIARVSPTTHRGSIANSRMRTRHSDASYEPSGRYNRLNSDPLLIPDQCQYESEHTESSVQTLYTRVETDTLWQNVPPSFHLHCESDEPQTDEDVSSTGTNNTFDSSHLIIQTPILENPSYEGRQLIENDIDQASRDVSSLYLQEGNEQLATQTTDEGQHESIPNRERELVATEGEEGAFNDLTTTSLNTDEVYV